MQLFDLHKPTKGAGSKTTKTCQTVHMDHMHVAPSKPCQNFLQHSFRECEISPRHIVYIKLLSLYNHYTARETRR